MSGSLPTSLAEVIARYLQEEEQLGHAPDRQQWLARYPELAEPLRTFFARHDQMRAVCRFADGETPPWQQEGVWSPESLELGGTFGDYELLEEVDRGGMGIVFRARQRSLDRLVAIKMLRAGVLADPHEVDRFLHEARAAAALEHPGIVPVHEVGEFQGLHFFCMGFIEGETLAHRMDQGPLDPAEAARKAMQIAQAIQYAHEQGVVHRDLKPANILVDQQGRTFITDFGLAKTLWESQPPTVTGQILGTPAYMAPEQTLGKPAQLGRAVDIYGLGTILYALLTGRPPYEADSAFGLLLKLRSSEPTPPRRHNPRVPGELERICLKCMEKRPPDRYASAEEVAADLQRFLCGEPIAAAPPTLATRVRRFTRHYPLLMTHLVVLLVASAIVLFNSFFVPEDPRYYLRIWAVLGVWVAASVGLQWLMTRRETETIARWAWAAADVLLLTAAIALSRPPRGPLMVGYSLLVTASALYFRVRYVGFVTTISIAAAAGLMLGLGDEPHRPVNAVLLAVALAALGLIMAGMVRHLLLLHRFYEPPER